MQVFRFNVYGYGLSISVCELFVQIESFYYSDKTCGNN